MNLRLFVASLIIAGLAHAPNVNLALEPLRVIADFEGASVRDIEIDEGARCVSFMPGGDPQRAWESGSSWVAQGVAGTSLE